MMAPQFGTDGVRGIANQELTPEVAVALGRASVEVLAEVGKKHVVIGRDTRKSGWMLQAGLVAGATAAGADVELLGVVPTPAVAWASSDRNVPGIMISASHNPFGDNGVKLFAPGGSKLNDSVEAGIQRRYIELLEGSGSAASDDTPVVGADIGTLITSKGVQGWVDSIVNSVDTQLDLTVAVDGANGAASMIGPEILRTLGARVIPIGIRPDGVNINDGYGSTSPERLQKAVVEQKADIGIGFDGDADRLIAVDPNGEIVNGDRVIAILAADWKSRNMLKGDTVVVTVMTNLGFHRAMKAAGVSVVTTGVGDRYVLEGLDAGGFSLGGEQSGHIICRDLASTGDGILSAVQLIDAVKRSGQTLDVLADQAMTSVPQVLQNVRLPNRETDITDGLAAPIAEVEEAFGEGGRVLVRPSGTEPLLRIMVEHVDADTANDTCAKLVATAQQLVN